MEIYKTDMKYPTLSVIFFFDFAIQLFRMVSIYYISYVQKRCRKYTLFLSQY